MPKEIMGVIISVLTLKLRKALNWLMGLVVNKDLSGWLPSSQNMGIVLMINNKANRGIHKPIRYVD